MKVRKITEQDWPTLSKWWLEWEFGSSPVKSLLPGDGTFGLIVEKQNIPIASIFIYQTNAQMAILAWPLSSRNYNEKDRSEAIKKLNSAAEQVCKSLNCKHILFFGDNRKYINKLKELGFSKGDSKYDIITKNI